MNTLRFELGRFEPRGFPTILPIIDDLSFLKLVVDFERHAGLVGALEYGPLVPHFMQPPMAPAHWFGRSEAYRPGTTVLLDCSCGSEGCWPLIARVGITDDAVTWSAPWQPNRDAWEYRIGPFSFDRTAYERAVIALFEQV